MAEEKIGITIEFEGKTTKFNDSLNGLKNGITVLNKLINSLKKDASLDSVAKRIDLLKEKQSGLTQITEKYKEELAKISDTGSSKYKSFAAGMYDSIRQTKGVEQEIYKLNIAFAEGNKERARTNTWLDEEIKKEQEIVNSYEEIAKVENMASGLVGEIGNQLNQIPSPLAIIKMTFEGINKQIDNCVNGINQAGVFLEGLGNTLGNISNTLSPLSNKVQSLFKEGITYNSNIEKYTMAMSNFVGSAEEADKIVKQIEQDSMKTQYGADALIKANQMLISVGVNADKSQEIIQSLGEAISATGGGTDELNRMAINLQQIKNYGKATLIDIRQFAYAGIDIYGILADYLGITSDKVKELDSISWDQISNAFIKASQDGGKYFGASAKQSETLSGKLTKLKSSYKQMLGLLSESVMPYVKMVVDKVQSVIDFVMGLDEKTINLITTIGLVLAAIAPVLKIMSIATTGIGKILQNVTKFNLIAGIVIGVLALMYANSEKFRETVNKVAKDLLDFLIPRFIALYEWVVALAQWVKETLIPSFIAFITKIADDFAPLIEIVIGLFEILWKVIEDVVKWLGKLWDKFIDSDVYATIELFFTNLINNFKDVYNWIVDIVEWTGKAIDKLKEWLGIKKQTSGVDVATTTLSGATKARSGGFGVNVPQVQSGGFAMSGGWTLNTTINVNNNGSNLTRNDVNRWADMISDRVNERLGRLM